MSRLCHVHLDSTASVVLQRVRTAALGTLAARYLLRRRQVCVVLGRTASQGHLCVVYVTAATTVPATHPSLVPLHSTCAAWGTPVPPGPPVAPRLAAIAGTTVQWARAMRLGVRATARAHYRRRGQDLSLTRRRQCSRRRRCGWLGPRLKAQ